MKYISTLDIGEAWVFCLRLVARPRKGVAGKVGRPRARSWSPAQLGSVSSGWRKMMDRNPWRAPMRTLLAILMLLALASAAAHAAPSRDCLSQAQAATVYPGKFLKYREIGSVRCWFAGPTPDKSE